MGIGLLGLRGKPAVQPVVMVLGQDEDLVLNLLLLMVEILVREMTLTSVYVIYDIAQVISLAAA